MVSPRRDDRQRPRPPAWAGYAQGARDVVVDGAEALRRYARSRTPAQAWGDAVEMAKGLGVSALEGGIREANKIADEDGFDLTRSFDRWVGDAIEGVVDKGKAAYAADRKAQASGRREDYKDAVLAVGGVTAAAADALTGGGKTKVAKAVVSEAQAVRRKADAIMRDADGVAQIGHNAPPATKKALATESRYLPPGQMPIVTQAGKRREPLGGREQLNAQHPSPFGPYHNIKPSVDPNEVRGDYRPMVEMRQPNMLTPADLEGSDVVSLYGDRSRAGEYLTGINGREFDKPVELHGGPDYGRMHEAEGSPAVWASEAGAVAALNGRIRRAIEAGRDVHGVYTPMGPKSLDQSTMMTDTLARMIQSGDIKKGDLKAFDRMVNSQGWKLPSVGNTDELIEVLGRGTQGARKLFVDEMDKGPWLEAGFPDVGAARIALTAPDMLDMPAGASGYRIVKFGPETLEAIDDPYRIHGSYDTPMAGQNVGQLDELVPFDMLFSDWSQARRAAGLGGGSDLRSLEMKKPYQTMTPEVVDRLMSFRAGAKKRR